jgi:hypothetical protein
MGQKNAISFVGPSFHSESCYGPHTIFSSLRIRGNVTHRSGAQVIRVQCFSEELLNDSRVDDLTKLDELHEAAVIQSVKHQQVMRRYHAQNVCSCNFQVGDFIL